MFVILVFYVSEKRLDIIICDEISKALWRFILLRSKVSKASTDILTKGFALYKNYNTNNFAL